jgi:uncharacterized repeat protein (TIGR03806 family)
MGRSIIIIIVMLFTVCLASYMDIQGKAYPEKLSGWKIFEGKMNDLKPAKGFVPYQLNSPLFSDYAEKLRFVKLPAGTSVNYNSGQVLDFPTGTMLVKTFYYSADNRKPGQNKNIIETRLLINEPGGWKAMTYVWNDDQTDAELEIAGDDRQLSFINGEGRIQHVRYVVPNQNQCKGCHNVNDKILPIGPSVGQLNGLYQYASGSQNQIEYWRAHGMLREVPKSGWPKTPVWNDPSSGSLDARARAYLAVNCAHCHRKEGPAQTSGLYLAESEKELTASGINKPPVAAGKGSGGRMVDILPGDAGASILWYRMQTTDPGERMPELGRNLVHKEGVELIKQWIDKMK